jgi:hypothetical protein
LSTRSVREVEKPTVAGPRPEGKRTPAKKKSSESAELIAQREADAANGDEPTAAAPLDVG